MRPSLDLVRGEGGCVCVFHPSPLYQIRKFFSMKFLTWIDFNNARISYKKILIFELYSMFLLKSLSLFCIHSLITPEKVWQRSKTKKSIISYKKKSLQWLSDNCAWIFLSMNSVHELIAVLFQRGTCIESICLRKENQRYFCQDAKFRSPPMLFQDNEYWYCNQLVISRQ